MLRPQLEYAKSVWSPWKKKDIRAIEDVQRRATKMLPGMKISSYEDRPRKLDLPTLVYCRMRDDMIETYEILQGKYGSELEPSWERQTSTTRGHEFKLF